MTTEAPPDRCPRCPRGGKPLLRTAAGRWCLAHGEVWADPWPHEVIPSEGPLTDEIPLWAVMSVNERRQWIRDRLDEGMGLQRMAGELGVGRVRVRQWVQEVRDEPV